ncbi:unnamed protein product [Ectocarpus sp. 12 AP-2014]
MRAVSSMEKFWRVYASVSHRELQFQSGGMRNKENGFLDVDNASRSRSGGSRARKSAAGGGGGGGGGTPASRPKRTLGSIEEETTHLLMHIIRQFFCEARRGIVTQLLFHILEGCEDDLELGKVVQDFLWSCWNLHDNEQVVKLMSEATKLQEAGSFDRSNAAVDKVLEIDSGHFEALNCRATNLLLQGALHESVAGIHKVLEMEPRHFGALRGLGLLRMNLKDYSGALGAFELTAKINPMLLPGLRDNMAVCQAAANAMLS